MASEPSLSQSADDPASRLASEAPSPEEIMQRVNNLYDRAEGDTGTLNLTRAAVVPRPGVSGAEAELSALTRRWFDVARNKLGPTVSAAPPTGSPRRALDRAPRTDRTARPERREPREVERAPRPLALESSAPSGGGSAAPSAPAALPQAPSASAAAGGTGETKAESTGAQAVIRQNGVPVALPDPSEIKPATPKTGGALTFSAEAAATRTLPAVGGGALSDDGPLAAPYRGGTGDNGTGSFDTGAWSGAGPEMTVRVMSPGAARTAEPLGGGPLDGGTLGGSRGGGTAGDGTLGGVGLGGGTLGGGPVGAALGDATPGGGLSAIPSPPTPGPQTSPLDSTGSFAVPAPPLQDPGRPGGQTPYGTGQPGPDAFSGAPSSADTFAGTPAGGIPAATSTPPGGTPVGGTPAGGTPVPGDLYGTGQFPAVGAQNPAPAAAARPSGPAYGGGGTGEFVFPMPSPEEYPAGATPPSVGPGAAQSQAQQQAQAQQSPAQAQDPTGTTGQFTLPGRTQEQGAAAQSRTPFQVPAPAPVQDSYPGQAQFTAQGPMTQAVPARPQVPQPAAQAPQPAQVPQTAQAPQPAVAQFGAASAPAPAPGWSTGAQPSIPGFEVPGTRPAAQPAPAAPAPQPAQGPVAQPAPGADPGRGAKGERVLAFAREQIGRPCVNGAVGPGAYDAPGLAHAAWRAAGVTLPRTARAQAESGTPVPLADLRVGDLVFFRDDYAHVGIWAGNGMMIHAPGPGAQIREESVFYAGQDAIKGAVRPA